MSDDDVPEITDEDVADLLSDEERVAHADVWGRQLAAMFSRLIAAGASQSAACRIVRDYQELSFGWE